MTAKLDVVAQLGALDLPDKNELDLRAKKCALARPVVARRPYSATTTENKADRQIAVSRR